MSDALMQPYCAVLLPFRAHFLSPYLRKNFKKKRRPDRFMVQSPHGYSVVGILAGSFEWGASTSCKIDVDLLDTVFVMARQNHLIDRIPLIVKVQCDSTHSQ